MHLSSSRRPGLCLLGLLFISAACAPSSGGDPSVDASTQDISAPPADVSSKPPMDSTVYVDVPSSIDPDASGPTPARDARAPTGDGGPLPNLVPVIQNTQIQERTFAMNACEVMEGCTVPGNRRLLRFDLLTPNVGRGDLYLGSPTASNRPPGMFEFGTCHNHWHLRGYADYRLVTMDGREVGRGHKQSFCLLDSGRYMNMGADIPGAQRYNCANQGIHAGWYDAYGRSLDCQYVDITGVPPGTYRIRARINVDRVVDESSYDDNESFLTVNIPAPSDAGVSNDPTLACPSDTEGVDRDCGWYVDGMPRRCTAGATVSVGCNAGCSPPIGTCTGDPMIRICPGTAPCRNAQALARNDDSCAPDGGRNLCASLRFTCPSSGQYTILTSSFRSGTSYECHVDVR